MLTFARQKVVSIGEAMSEAFEVRYGLPFQSFANGIERADWDWSAKPEAREGLLIRYSGSLAEDMGLETLLMVACVVEQLATSGLDISLEVKTRKFWEAKAGEKFKDLSRTTLLTDEMTPANYKKWLSGADIVLICYNFDDRSKDYVRYSIANKLPECLAAGAPLLAIGPADIAMMQILRRLDCCESVESHDPQILCQSLGRLAASKELRDELAGRARAIALDKYDMRIVRQKFVSWILATTEFGRTDKAVRAMRGAESRLRSITRDVGARLSVLESALGRRVSAKQTDDSSGVAVSCRNERESAMTFLPSSGSDLISDFAVIGDQLGKVVSSISARFPKSLAGR